MEIQLKKLELTNYRNIDYANFEFDGSCAIIGENRIGKTNILESIYWLLTDKLLDSSSDSSSIKPLKDTKQQVIVKATFDVDGKIITLEKQYSENWVKTRGTNELIFQGHTIKYFYNGIKQSTIKAFQQLFYEDFNLNTNENYPIDILQSLINPYYLGNLGEETPSWTKFREFIIKLVGNVSDDDVFKSNDSLLKIQNDLKVANGRIDQLKKKYLNDIDSCKKTIELKKSQMQLLEQTKKPTDDEIEISKKAIEEHKDKIASLKIVGIDNASILIQEKINSKESEIIKLKKEDNEKSNYSNLKNDLSKEIFELRIKQNNLLSEKSNKLNLKDIKNKELNECLSVINNCNKVRQDLINELNDIDENINNPKIITCCPTCGREYEDDFIKVAQENEISRLKSLKEDLIKKGIDNKTLKKSKETELDNINNELSELESSCLKINKSIDDITVLLESKENELRDLSNKVIDENPLIKDLEKEIELLKEELRDSRDNFYRGQQNNQQLIYEEQQAMIPYKNLLADYDHYQRNMVQLDILKNETNVIQMELIDLEQKKELLNQFNLIKLGLIDKNVSQVFGNIKFQLVKENINGGFDNVCKPYIYDEVSDSSTNTTWKNGSKSERIATGIAMMERIKEKLNLPNLPILFDEGGEVSLDTFKKRLKTNSQIICVKIVDDITTPTIVKIER